MDLTLAGAFAAGLATSLHCAGMCGPLACGVGTFARSDTERLAAALSYHVARLAAYATIGTLCGALGREPLGWFFSSPAVLLPWAFVAALLLLATGLEKKIPRPVFLTRLILRARTGARRLPVVAGAGLTGLATPFLPCGPLYAVFLALLASGSAARGAEAALAFGLGTVPLLWVAQHQFHRLRLRLSPVALRRFQRGLALLTAIVLAWRLHDTLPFNAIREDPAGAARLPACCH